MKKNNLKLLLVLIGLTLLYMPIKAINYNNYNNMPNKVIPDSLMKIFNKACVCCHSKEGNFFVKSKLNFSKWDNYSTLKQQKKANLICDELTSKSMPPENWKKKNEKLIPTDKEIKEICKWSNSLNSLK